MPIVAPMEEPDVKRLLAVPVSLTVSGAGPRSASFAGNQGRAANYRLLAPTTVNKLVSGNRRQAPVDEENEKDKKSRKNGGPTRHKSMPRGRGNMTGSPYQSSRTRWWHCWRSPGAAADFDRFWHLARHGVRAALAQRAQLVVTRMRHHPLSNIRPFTGPEMLISLVAPLVLFFTPKRKKVSFSSHHSLSLWQSATR